MNETNPTTASEEGELRDVAAFHLVPRDAHLSIEYGGEHRPRRRITMRVDLREDQNVRLPNDRSLNEAEWWLTLNESARYSDVADKEDAIGRLIHAAQIEDDGALVEFSPEACFVIATLNPETFSPLLQAIQSGRLPTQVQVAVRGMRFGWEPDGSGTIWDVEKRRTARVTDISFALPLIAPRQEPPAELKTETIETDGLPATTGDIRALQRQIVELASTFQLDAAKGWLVVVVLLLLLVVLLYFRK